MKLCLKYLTIGRCLSFISLAVGILLFSNEQVSAQRIDTREYNIKAVFLFNFSQFVDWPFDAFSNSQSPFVIGILGDDPFQFLIDKTVSGEMVKGHPIVIQRYQTLGDLKPCHILYVSEKDEGKIKEIMSALSNKNTLTVSEYSNFTKLGGMVRFMTLNNRIKLQINLSAAKAANINISSKLLSLANIVGPMRQ